jgi:hypothetical protein
VKLPKHKVLRIPEFSEVIYNSEHWNLLRKLRNDALDVMKKLISCGFRPVIYGSVARGDVDPSSDIDVVITYTVEPYRIINCLELRGYIPKRKYIVIATPSSTPKGYIELDDLGLKTVSFPLSPLNPREYEFYKFGGLLTYNDLVKNIRVPGVTKQLVLIIPTDVGHKEAPVIGYEGFASKLLGISIETVNERIRILTRRDRHGRTGVYVKYELAPHESFEDGIRELIKQGKIRI